MPELFLLHEKNAAFIDGLSQSPIIKSQSANVIRIVSYIFVFSALVGIIGSVISYRKYRILQNRGAVITGRYIDKSTKKDSEGSITYYAFYEFFLDDTRYTNRNAVPRRFYQAVSIGNAVEILYDVQNPKLSRVASLHKLPEQAFAFTGFMIAIILVLQISAALVGGRYNDLRKHGVVIYGQVTASREYRDNDNARWIKVKYMFPNPETTDVLEGVHHAIAMNTELPEKGDRVAVLYLNPNLYRLL